MRKTFLLLMAFCLSSMLAFSADRSWNLRSWGEQTLADLLLDADWKKNDATPPTTYTYVPKVTTEFVATANGNPIVELSGLTFTTGNTERLMIDTRSSGSFRLSNTTAIVYIPNCTAGDIITISWSSTGSSSRSLNAKSNATPDAGNAASASSTPVTNIYTVVADGKVSFESTGGVQLYSISVKEYVADVPTVSLESGTANPTIYVGQSLEALVFEMGGTATTIDIAWTGTADASTLPAGITVTPTSNGLTVEGDPTVPGVYGYTVTSYDATLTPSATPATGTITVNAVAPTIALTAGPESQFVYLGQTIEPVGYTIGGGADGYAIVWTGTADAATPPAGILPALAGDVVTISGTPTALGTYGYSITATYAATASAPLTGTIEAKDGSSLKKMAYMTDLASTLDKPFLDAFRDLYYVELVSAADASFDYSDIDVLVLSAVPNSTAAGLLALKNTAVTIPFLNMKSFAMQASNNRWAWMGAPGNTTVPNIIVPDDMKSHAIFAGVTWTGDDSNEIQLTTKGSGNQVIYLSSWTSPSQEPLVLSQVDVGGTIHPSFAEVEIGTTLNGTPTSTAAQILYNLSESCWDALTDDAVKIAVNAVDYVISKSVSIECAPAADAANKVEVAAEYYDLMGRVVSGAPKGIVIKKSVYEDGSVSFKKAYIK